MLAWITGSQLADDVGQKGARAAGLNEKDAAEVGHVAGALPLIAGTLKSGADTLAAQHAQISAEAAQKFQNIGDQLEPARTAAGGTLAEPIKVTLKGPSGPFQAEVQVNAVGGPDNTPFFKVVGPDGKRIYSGKPGFVAEWLGRNVVSTDSLKQNVSDWLGNKALNATAIPESIRGHMQRLSDWLNTPNNNSALPDNPPALMQPAIREALRTQRLEEGNPGNLPTPQQAVAIAEAKAQATADALAAHGEAIHAQQAATTPPPTPSFDFAPVAQLREQPDWDISGHLQAAQQLLTRAQQTGQPVESLLASSEHPAAADTVAIAKTMQQGPPVFNQALQAYVQHAANARDGASPMYEPLEQQEAFAKTFGRFAPPEAPQAHESPLTRDAAQVGAALAAPPEEEPIKKEEEQNDHGPSVSLDGSEQPAAEEEGQRSGNQQASAQTSAQGQDEAEAPAGVDATPDAEEAPAAIPAASSDLVTVKDGTTKEHGIKTPLEAVRNVSKPQNDIHGEPTGWLLHPRKIPTLVHPTADRLVSFTPKNEKSGTDLQGAHAQAQAFAMDHPIEKAPAETAATPQEKKIADARAWALAEPAQTKISHSTLQRKFGIGYGAADAILVERDKANKKAEEKPETFDELYTRVQELANKGRWKEFGHPTKDTVARALGGIPWDQAQRLLDRWNKENPIGGKTEEKKPEEIPNKVAPARPEWQAAALRKVSPTARKIYAALERLGTEGMASSSSLRTELGNDADKETFDKAAVSLQKAGLVRGIAHDSPLAINATERAALIETGEIYKRTELQAAPQPLLWAALQKLDKLPPRLSAETKEAVKTEAKTPWYRDPAKEEPWFKEIRSRMGAHPPTWQQLGEAYEAAGKPQMLKDFAEDWADETGPAGRQRQKFAEAAKTKPEAKEPAAAPEEKQATQTASTSAVTPPETTIEEATDNERTAATTENGTTAVQQEQPDGATDSPALAGVPAGNVRGPRSQGGTRNGSGRSGGSDSGRAGETLETGSSAQPGVGNGAGGVGVSSGGTTQAQGETLVGPGNLAAQSTGRDYRITDADALGEGTVREKLDRNLAAIRLVKALAAEKRPATPEEQKVLAGFVGWGGLKDAFDPWGQPGRAFAGAREELKNLLTAEEYAAAEKSTYNAHYTSPLIVRWMWNALAHLGLTPNTSILEPAFGSGNFFGLQPASLLPARRTGIELDTLTGAIAKALYPDANIQVTGFERINLPHNFFDVAISNVPFGNVPVYDRLYPAFVTRAIHNYFFVKGLDLVRPGGIVAFVTSSFTMDAPTSAPLRKLLAEKANLLGAIRLPNTAFKANAGTEVTTDIIFLQKRASGTTPSGPQWENVSSVPTPDGKPIPVNEYYAAHPSMMLGQMDYSGKMRHGGGEEPTLEGKLTPELLAAAVAQLPSNVFHSWEATEDHREGVSVYDLGDKVKDGGYTVKEGTLAQRVGSVYQPKAVKSVREEARIRGMIGLRDAVREVRRTQLEEAPAKEIVAARKALEKLYDAFVKAQGPVNNRANIKAFRDDPDFVNIQALENYDEDTGTATKTDVFRERTIEKAKVIEHVDRADEALAITLNERGRIDWDRMQQLTGKTPDELRAEMGGLIYHDPGSGKWQTADEYLSGNVRAKLETAEAAAAADPRYQSNVDALRKVIPEDLQQSDIRVNLGASWIPADVVRTFAQRVFDLPGVEVRYSPTVATWTVRLPKTNEYQKNRANNAQVWGTDDFFGHELLDMALNSRSPKVWMSDGDGGRVVNPVATQTAQAMQDAIRKRFAEWVWEDAERAAALAKNYNKEFNGLRNREFDGSHLTLPGKNPGIKLHSHQLNAIWRAIQTGNTLLAHEVGAGKTWEMVAIAMESRRLGLARKPMLVVPNHMIEQFAGEFKQLYPNAKLLALGRNDLAKGKRQLALARIANGNWDAVIVAQSSYGLIGVSDQTFAAYMDKQAAMLRTALEELTAEGDGGKKPSRTFKEIQKALERLKVLIEKRAKREGKDKALTFEELGVDMILADEAHAYKKLPIVTKRNRVAGLPNGSSQRAMDMHMKTEYVSAPWGGKRGVIFATGTPVTNTLAELYNMQRFLQPSALRAAGIEHFDAWANTFALSARSVELDITGAEYREIERFSHFVNMPELARLFREIADVKTAEDLKLPTPEVEGGDIQAITAPASEAIRAFVKGLMKRAQAIRGGGVDPKTDNMLKISSEGKKAALDMRLVDPHAPDLPESKVNKAVASILHIWEETKAARSTQMVFCDLSTPKLAKAKKATPKDEDEDDQTEEADSTEPADENLDTQAAGERAGFSVYDDMRAKLIAAGIPADEIAFIHHYNTDAEKKVLFRQVNKGIVRVIFGSSEKMGVGTNVQKKLIALHMMDTPWRPADITQRVGRIKRQGNENPVIRVYQYLTEGSLDAMSWQTIATKAKMVGQAMSNNLNLRDVEDVGVSIPTASEFMAMASGDPIIRENIGVTAELARLQAQRAGHLRQQESTLRLRAELPARIASHQAEIAKIEADVATAEKNKDAGFTIGKTHFGGEGARAKAAEALEKAINASGEMAEFITPQLKNEPRLHWYNAQTVGRYRGLTLITRPSQIVRSSYPDISITGKSVYHANSNREDPLATIASIEATVRNIANRLIPHRRDLDEYERKLAELNRLGSKAFPFETRFQELVKRKAEITAQLAASEAEKASLGNDDGDGTAAMRAAGKAPAIAAAVPILREAFYDAGRAQSKSTLATAALGARPTPGQAPAAPGRAGPRADQAGSGGVLRQIRVQSGVGGDLPRQVSVAGSEEVPARLPDSPQNGEVNSPADAEEAARRLAEEKQSADAAKDSNLRGRARDEVASAPTTRPAPEWEGRPVRTGGEHREFLRQAQAEVAADAFGEHHVYVNNAGRELLHLALTQLYGNDFPLFHGVTLDERRRQVDSVCQTLLDYAKKDSFLAPACRRLVKALRDAETHDADTVTVVNADQAKHEVHLTEDEEAFHRLVLRLTDGAGLTEAQGRKITHLSTPILQKAQMVREQHPHLKTEAGIAEELAVLVLNGESNKIKLTAGEAQRIRQRLLDVLPADAKKEVLNYVRARENRPESERRIQTALGVHAEENAGANPRNDHAGESETASTGRGTGAGTQTDSTEEDRLTSPDDDALARRKETQAGPRFRTPQPSEPIPTIQLFAVKDKNGNTVRLGTAAQLADWIGKQSSRRAKSEVYAEEDSNPQIQRHYSTAGEIETRFARNLAELRRAAPGSSSQSRERRQRRSENRRDAAQRHAGDHQSARQPHERRSIPAHRGRKPPARTAGIL